jgi:hypothetical protein
VREGRLSESPVGGWGRFGDGVGGVLSSVGGFWIESRRSRLRVRFGGDCCFSFHDGVLCSFVQVEDRSLRSSLRSVRALEWRGPTTAQKFPPFPFSPTARSWDPCSLETQ